MFHAVPPSFRIFMSICLEADSILKCYGERTILSDIYLRCKPGDITALWGRNGSGKSTLLEIIFGTLKAEHAFVRVGGRVVNGQAYRTGLVAFLPQFHFLPGNLRVAQLLHRTGLPNLPEAFGDMPVPPLRERLKNLSGGQLRLLEILYVTSLPAPFLLLDEPFTGLSPVAADTIARHLQAVSRQKGILIADHDYRTLQRIATRHLLLADGYLRPLTSPDELRRCYLP